MKILHSRMPRLYSAYKQEYDEAILSSLCLEREFTGPIVESFENRIAKLTNRKYAVCTLTCTLALYFACRAVSIVEGFGKNILSQAYVHIAPVSQAMAAGFNVYLNDIDEYANISLTNDYDVDFSCIIFAGLFGNTIDYDELEKFKNKFNIRYSIDDNAQSFGSFWKGNPAASYADISCISFDVRKVLTSPFGMGGMCLTDNEELYNLIKSFRAYGSVTGSVGADQKTDYIGGTNGYLPQQLAAALMVSLDHFEEELIRRKEIWRYYRESLSDLPLDFIDPHPNTWSCSSKFPILLKNREEKCKLFDHFISKEIIVSQNFPNRPLNSYGLMFPGSSLICDGNINRSNEYCDRVLTLPIHPHLTDYEVETVVETLTRYLKG